MGINHQSYSQDLIVTKQNDSINSYIKNITTKYIYFFSKNDSYQKKQKINKSTIASYKINFYKNDNDFYFTKKKSLTFDVSTGYSLRLHKTIPIYPSENTSTSNINKLKSGYHFNIDAIYNIDDISGFGLKYISSTYNHNIYHSPSENKSITFGDNINIKYFGPFLNLKNNKKLYCNLGAGFLGIDNNTQAINNPLIIKGNTIGALIEIGKSFKLTSQLHLGIQSSMLFGHLYTINVYDGNSKDHVSLDDELNESLNTFHLSVGLKYIP